MEERNPITSSPALTKIFEPTVLGEEEKGLEAFEMHTKLCNTLIHNAGVAGVQIWRQTWEELKEEVLTNNKAISRSQNKNLQQNNNLAHFSKPEPSCIKMKFF